MASASTEEIIAFLDELLDPGSFPDYCPNGLQVPGPQTVSRVVTGVSAHGDLLDAAAAQGADMVLVHHGLFWNGQPLEVTPVMHRRLKPLFTAPMALATYHLPLDAHPEHGNNALIAQALGLEDVARLGRVGSVGRLPAPEALHDFAARVQALVGDRPPLVIEASGDPVQRVGIVSGAATDQIHEAAAAGCDTFLTGEPAERGFGLARDAGINFLAAGHHATETFGIKRLGELLAQRFGVEHIFIDVENPI